MDFQELVNEEITLPIVALCQVLVEEGEMDQHAFFRRASAATGGTREGRNGVGCSNRAV